MMVLFLMNRLVRGPFLLIFSISFRFSPPQKKNRLEVRSFTRATSNLKISKSYLLFSPTMMVVPFPMNRIKGGSIPFYFTLILSPKKVNHVELKDNSNGLSDLSFLYLRQGKQG